MEYKRKTTGGPKWFLVIDGNPVDVPVFSERQYKFLQRGLHKSHARSYGFVEANEYWKGKKAEAERASSGRQLTLF